MQFRTKQKKQVISMLSKDLKEKYKKRNIRIRKGDTVKVMRGEYKGVDGKVAKIMSNNSRIAIEGIKREKSKGEKVDVSINASNVQITSIDNHDKLRKKKLENKTNNNSE